jgi:C-terminal processing protease CtpA/Prc
MHPIEDGIVVAVSDGADILINKPSVLVNVNVNVNVNRDESFESFESYSTELSSSTTNEEEEETNVEDDPSTIGPFSGFRRRRAERRASSIALRDERIRAENVRREERMQADDARNKAREEVRRQADEKRQMAKEAIPETMLEANFDSLRAARISVTVVKDESNSYGLGLVQVPRKKNMVKIDALVNEGLLSESPLRVGDIIKTVNNKAVTEHRPVMLQLMNIDGPVTITVETPTPHGNPAVVQAFCRKPTIETLVGISFSVTEHCTTQNELCGAGTQEVTTTKLLKINTIESYGLLANSALSPGDLVLAINGVPCKSPDEATALILESSFTVNILALNPKLAQEHCGPTRTQRWMRGAKRAGIAVGGGTMRK